MTRTLNTARFFILKAQDAGSREAPGLTSCQLSRLGLIFLEQCLRMGKLAVMSNGRCLSHLTRKGSTRQI